MASEGAAPLRKALAFGRWELCRMKSFQPGYFGSSPCPARPVVVTSLGARGLVVLHMEAPSKPVCVPKPASSKFHLCPAVGLVKPCTPGVFVSESTSTGLSRFRRSKIENFPVLSSPAE